MVSLCFGQENLDLSGTWQFSTSKNNAQSEDWTKPGYNDADWDTLQVPGNWDTENKYAHFSGTGYYIKHFSVPENWSSEFVRLYFSAVYQKAEVWLNGQYLGEHVGGYTPFDFDVTKQLRYGETNTLAVAVDNTYNRGAWWKWGGVSRPVYLIKEKQIRIVRQKVDAEPNLEDGTSTVGVELVLLNQGDTAFNGEVTSRIIDWKSQKAHGEIMQQRLTVGPGEETRVLFHFDLGVEDTHLWNLHDPHLYELVTRVSEGESVVAVASDRFGIRKISTANAKLLLNGEPVYASGLNRIATHRAYGVSEPDDLVKFDIDAMLAMGVRMTRISHYAQAPGLLDYCDEKGVLLIEEIPVWGKTDPQVIPDNPQTKEWLREMIERDYNHPSIIGWSVGNELAEKKLDGQKMSWKVYEYVRTMLEYVDTLDPTRLKTYVSNTATQANGQGIDPADHVDILMHNSYGGAPDQVKKLHRIWPNKPIFVSELGKSRLGERLDAELAPELISEIEELQELDFVVGCSLWSFNDYRSHFNNTSPSENRTWGVYNVWRQPKKAAYQVRNLFMAGSATNELPSMLPEPEEMPEGEVYIQAVLPLKSGCMVGFSVLDKKADYELSYQRNGGSEHIVKLDGVRGAAKLNDLESGDYSLRIREGGSEKWSAPYRVAITNE